MFNTIPPITRNLIIINIVVFIAASLIPLLDLNLTGFYPFSPNFKSWQIITHMFMHGSIMHILFNMFTLFSFGPILEQSLGDKKYLILYFLSGLGAFFLFNLWNFIEIQQLITQLEEMKVDVSEIYSKSDLRTYGYSDTIYLDQPLSRSLYEGLTGGMVGASGAIFGVIAAFATLYPEAKIGIMFIPVPVKVKYVLPVVVIGSVYLGLTGNVGGIAHLAHVGGAIVGFILAKIWKKHLYRFN